MFRPLVLSRGIRYVRKRKPGKPEQRETDDIIESLQSLEKINNDPNLSFTSKSAAALQTYLKFSDNQHDRKFWKSVESFASLNPDASTLKTLLPKLWTAVEAAPKPERPALFQLVGDLAYSANSLEQLGTTRMHVYVESLSKFNPYRAIELWNKYKPLFGLEAGIAYYLRANQIKKAESLVTPVMPLSPSLCKQFILAYCKQQDLKGVSKYVEKLQAPRPDDVQWVWHALKMYNMEAAGKTLTSARKPVPNAPSELPLSRNDEFLVKQVSDLFMKSQHLLEDLDGYKLWAGMLTSSDPQIQVLEVLDLLASNRQFEPGELFGVFRHLNDANRLALALKMDTDPNYPALEPREWALAVASAPPEALPTLVEKMRVNNNVFTASGFSAVCAREPANLVGLADEARKFQPLQEHQLIHIWRTMGLQVPSWLWSETVERLASYRLLKVVVKNRLNHGDIVGVARALYGFQVTNGCRLEPLFLTWMLNAARDVDTTVRFSRPVRAPDGHRQWLEACTQLCEATHTVPSWVRERAQQAAQPDRAHV